MVLYSSLRDCKSPKVSMIFLSILTELNNTELWMVFIHLPISNISSYLFKPWKTFQMSHLQLVSPSPSYSKAFIVLKQVSSPSVSVYFLWLTLCGLLRLQSLLTVSSLFPVPYHSVLSSDLDLVIHMYLKIPENFIRQIL